MEDNLLKAAVEAHIFLLVSVALVLKGLRVEAGHNGEVVPEWAYDVVLVVSFVVGVPMAFVWAVSRKKTMIEQALGEAAVADKQSLAARKRAIRFLQLGLTTNDDMTCLSEYFTKLDTMVNSMS
eukprot:SAG22_NODE_33_length_27588_cov_104.174652_8_plen_124_part_00